MSSTFEAVAARPLLPPLGEGVTRGAANAKAAKITDHRALRFLTAGSVDDGKST